jgi:hypothetical protein
MAWADIDSSLKTLSLRTAANKSPKAAEEPVAESWDDDELSSESSTPTTSRAPLSPPSAPPPTPSSPSTSGTRMDADWGSFENPYALPAATAGKGDKNMDRRPEKSTAAAGRLIAGALGVRPPKKSEEMREYERVIREKELKRREKERAEKKRGDEEREKAREEIWDG